MAQTRRRDP